MSSVVISLFSTKASKREEIITCSISAPLKFSLSLARISRSKFSGFLFLFLR